MNAWAPGSLRSRLAEGIGIGRSAAATVLTMVSFREGCLPD
jgi:hypothetical protein